MRCENSTISPGTSDPGVCSRQAPFEDTLRLALAIGGDVTVLVQSGVAIFLWCGVLAIILVRILVQWFGYPPGVEMILPLIGLGG
jgi:hypothetical protein